MGDVLTLIDKAKEAYEEAEAEAGGRQAASRGSSPSRTSSSRCRSSRRWARCRTSSGLMPGMPKEVRQAQIDDDQIGRVEAIIRSMTRAERADPDIIDASRRARIAPARAPSRPR